MLQLRKLTLMALVQLGILCVPNSRECFALAEQSPLFVEQHSMQLRQLLERTLTPVILCALTLWHTLHSWTLQLSDRLAGYTVEFPPEITKRVVTYEFQWSNFTWKAFIVPIKFPSGLIHDTTLCVTLRTCATNFSVPYLVKFSEYWVVEFPDSGQLQAAHAREAQVNQEIHILIQRDQTVFVCKDKAFWIRLGLLEQGINMVDQLSYFQNTPNALSLAYGNATMNEAKSLREYRKHPMFIQNQNQNKESKDDTISIVGVNRGAKETKLLLQVKRTSEPVIAPSAAVDKKLDPIVEQPVAKEPERQEKTSVPIGHRPMQNNEEPTVNITNVTKADPTINASTVNLDDAIRDGPSVDSSKSELPSVDSKMGAVLPSVDSKMGAVLPSIDSKMGAILETFIDAASKKID